MTGSLQKKNGYYHMVLNFYVDGKRKQKWVSTGLQAVDRNATKAKAMLDQVISDQGGQAMESDILFVEYLNRWLESKRSNIQLSTWKSYEIYINSHIIPYFSPLKLLLCEVKRKHIEGYYAYKAGGGRMDNGEGGLNYESLKKHRQLLIKTLENAVEQGLIEYNPAQGVRNVASKEQSG